MTPIVGIMAPAGAGKDTAADHLVQAHGFVKYSLADEMKRFAREAFGFTYDQLWGPSGQRNALDTRYNYDEAWVEAQQALFKKARTWVRRLWPDAHPLDIWRREVALYHWFLDLYFTYGPRGAKAGLSPRIVLQTIGTEYGRVQDPTVWLNLMLRTAETVSRGYGSYSQTEGFLTCVKPPKGFVVPDCRFRNEKAGVKSVGGVVVRLKRAGVTGAVGIQGHQSEVEQASIPDDEFDYVINVAEGIPNFHKQVDEFVEFCLKETK